LVAHRPALVEQDGTPQIRFFLVLANVNAIRLPENLPVDMTRLVATDVLTMLLELDTEALVWRTVQAGTESLDDASGKHLQVG
jgi:hypothetical protein